MGTQRVDEAPADCCRRMGWGVGTVLEGDEGRGPERIVITAIGEQDILARYVDTEHGEGRWTLECREWKKVGERDVTTSVLREALDDQKGLAAELRAKNVDLEERLATLQEFMRLDPELVGVFLDAARDPPVGRDVQELSRVAKRLAAERRRARSEGEKS